MSDEENSEEKRNNAAPRRRKSKDHGDVVATTAHVLEKGSVHHLSFQRQRYRRNVPSSSLPSCNGDNEDGSKICSGSMTKLMWASLRKSLVIPGYPTVPTTNKLRDANEETVVGALSVNPSSRGDDEESVTSIDDLIALAVVSNSPSSEVAGSGTMTLPPPLLQRQEVVRTSRQQREQRQVSEAELDGEQTGAFAVVSTSVNDVETPPSAIHVASAHLVMDTGSNEMEWQAHESATVVSATPVETKKSKWRFVWVLLVLLIILAAVLATYLATRQRLGRSSNEDTTDSFVPTQAPVSAKPGKDPSSSPSTSLSQLGGDLLIEKHEVTSISLSQYGLVLAVGSAQGSASVYRLQPNDGEWILRHHTGLPPTNERTFFVPVDLSSDGSKCVLSVPDSSSAQESVGHLLQWNEDESVYEVLGFDGSQTFSPDLAAVISSNGSYGVFGSRRDCLLDVVDFDGALPQIQVDDFLRSSVDCEEKPQTPSTLQVGWSLAMGSVGSILVVGSPGASEIKGTVEVFRHTRGGWIQAGHTLTGVAAGDQYGYSVSIAEDDPTYVAVGSPGYDDDSGFVGVYQWNKWRWENVGDPIIATTAGERLGLSVSLSSDGRSLAVGSSTKVQVYRRFGRYWEQVGMDIQVESDLVSSMGGQVSFGGNKTLAVGFPLASEPNSLIRLFEVDDGTT